MEVSWIQFSLLHICTTGNKNLKNNEMKIGHSQKILGYHISNTVCNKFHLQFK